MINDNTLGNKLNDYIDNSDPSQGSSQLPTNSLFNSLTTFFSLVMLALKVLVFGFSVKIVFSTNWNLLSTLCVGLAISFLLTYIYDLIHDKIT